MTCTACKISAAPFELINGLCHACTAKELETCREHLDNVVTACSQIDWCGGGYCKQCDTNFNNVEEAKAYLERVASNPSTP